MKYERDFKGVWIPKQIWLDENLGWSEKCLLVEIESLDNEKGCFSGNKHFADFFGLSENRISKMISALRDKGYLTVDIKIDKTDGFKRLRTIRVDKIKFHGIVEKSLAKSQEGIGENDIEGIGENDTYNNTSINNTNNIKTSSQKFSTFDIQASERLFELMQINNPTAKKPNLEKWANDVRLMRERDNRTEEQIMYLIEWSQNDSFWKSNILSTGKLREKFDSLVIKIKFQKEHYNKSNIVKNNNSDMIKMLAEEEMRNAQSRSNNFISNY